MPSRARAAAAELPAGPPPMTRTRVAWDWIYVSEGCNVEKG